MTKYHNKKTTVDGTTFDSLKEYSRFRELQLMVKAGEIRNLAIKPRYELQRAFDDDDGNRHKPISYTPDFQYEDKKYKWELVVEDVKGVRTQSYRIKKKLFLFRYPYHFLET